jgi:cysteinyl-tRNA synthetase
MMWPFSRRVVVRHAHPAHIALSPLYFHNTLSGENDEFTLPGPAHAVRMYNCGPTVYGRQHIGNLSMFVFTDVLRRTLEFNGFNVKQVINITDVGHLTSDSDEGEDKMSKGLVREGLSLTLENMRTLGEKYTTFFFEDLRMLNIDTDRIEFPRASDYISAQIAMIQTLVDKSYAYTTGDGVYFDTAQFPRYGELGGIDLTGLREGARVAASSEKHHATDFALWKFDETIGWESPWGKGFPGWHIECSAMIRGTLGEQIDIHTGGIEHIPIHHNNEIAQSEAAIGKRPLSRFWLHRAHIQFEGGKLAKSAGNVIYLSDVTERGFHPLALRYLFLGAHYRTSANFSWDALDASQAAFLRLRAFVQKYQKGGTISEKHLARFRERINDDLDTPGALSVLWEMIKDETLLPEDIRATIVDCDRVLGLRLAQEDIQADALYTQRVGQEVAVAEAPEDIQLLVTKREEARSSKQWSVADDMRAQLQDRGYTIEDSSSGPTLFRH